MINPNPNSDYDPEKDYLISYRHAQTMKETALIEGIGIGAAIALMAVILVFFGIIYF